jgi:acetyltransferase-like isoleucine patch superfamily enzyme
MRLDLELRRKGGRLVLEADSTPEMEALPVIRAVRKGAGNGTFTLRIGDAVRFGRGVNLEIWASGSNRLEIGDHSVLDGCILQLRSGSIRMRDHVQVRGFAILKSYGDLRLGSGVIVNYSNALHCESEIELEDLVGTAERVTIVDSDKELSAGDDYFNDRPSRVGAVFIGRNTYIACGVVITRGTRIGPSSAIGANAVVTGGEYPGGWLIAGIPARAIKEFAEDEAEHGSLRALGAEAQ